MKKNLNEYIQILKDEDVWDSDTISIIEKLCEKETWTNIVIAQKVYTGYSISSYGNLVSHKRRKSNVPASLRTQTYIDPAVKIPIKFSCDKDKTGKICSQYKKITLPENFFDGTYLEGKTFHKNTETTITYRRHAHQLVMEAFLPIFKNPPRRLDKVWDQVPKEAKQWISESVIVDHISCDPTDNMLCNLRYGTFGENTRWAKQHYNGNFTNKIRTNLITKKNQASILPFFS